MKITIGRGDRSEAGAALVELAFALPILVLIMVAAIDFARIFYLGISLTNAARAGAQYGSHLVSNTDPPAGMENAALSAANIPGMTADASRTCFCATNDAAFSATSPVNTCTATSCPTAGTHLVITVTVTTGKTFTSIIGGVPGIPDSIPLERSATMRVAN